ncbi:MAG: hypothetical protein Q4G68_15060 [Planctomycetia bacterium]|nr:hypothetical protein [Planctomycetia bacterium]
MLRFCRCVSVGLLVTLLCMPGLGQESQSSPVIKKKMIELGWDSPSTQFLRDNWQEMEQKSPFDGVIFRLAPDGKPSSLELMSAAKWNKEDYASCIDDLKACHFQQFTDNFVNIFFTPGNVDWQDDAGWSAVAEKAGICAWVAQESGCRGISLDFESYGEAMFQYKPEKGLSWQETCALAERRGREFVDAIACQKPDAVLLCLWMNSINLSAGMLPDPNVQLRGEHYGLLPAFINGMLAAAPKEMTFVDGCEYGYYYNSQSEYQKAALDMLLITGPATNLVKPELRDKYRTQVQAGFGFYLDMFTNPEGNVFYRGPKEGGTRLDRLRDNLTYAWNSADQYVWVYGEKHRWWNVAAGGPDSRHWDEALPGLLDTLRTIKNPDIAGARFREKVTSDPNAVNLVKNGDFSLGTTGEAPSDWWTWQIENKPAGTLLWDAESHLAVAKNVYNGCFGQNVPVKPGEVHYVRCKIKSNEMSSASMSVRWKSPSGTWTQQAYDVRCYVAPDAHAPDADGYYTVEKVVMVPEETGFLVILLSGRAQAPNDWAFFKDVAVY